MEVDGLEGDQKQQQQPNHQDQQPQSQPAPSTRACELAKYLDMAVQRMKAVGPARFFAEEVRPWEGCARRALWTQMQSIGAQGWWWMSGALVPGAHPGTQEYGALLLARPQMTGGLAQCSLLSAR